MQPLWIVYALLTGQPGVVPGCLVSSAVQVRNFLDGQGVDVETKGTAAA